MPVLDKSSADDEKGKHRKSRSNRQWRRLRLPVLIVLIRVLADWFMDQF
jgi:hypothetical protein